MSVRRNQILPDACGAGGSELVLMYTFEFVLRRLEFVCRPLLSA